MLFKRRYEDIGADEARARLERGDAITLDVREHGEWRAGHIPGAVHIPMGDLSRRADELPRDREIVAVCRSGGRSGRVAGALAVAGYRVVNLEGGMKAWHRAGLPMEPPDGTVA